MPGDRRRFAQRMALRRECTRIFEAALKEVDRTKVAEDDSLAVAVSEPFSKYESLLEVFAALSQPSLLPPAGGEVVVGSCDRCVVLQCLGGRETLGQRGHQHVGVAAPDELPESSRQLPDVSVLPQLMSKVHSCGYVLPLGLDPRYSFGPIDQHAVVARRLAEVDSGTGKRLLQMSRGSDSGVQVVVEHAERRGLAYLVGLGGHQLACVIAEQVVETVP